MPFLSSTVLTGDFPSMTTQTARTRALMGQMMNMPLMISSLLVHAAQAFG